MITSGKDSGYYSFEKEHFIEHLTVFEKIMQQIYGIKIFKIKLMQTPGYPNPSHFMNRILETLEEQFNSSSIIIEQPIISDVSYYQGLHFQIYINLEGEDIEVGDGGFVDWSKKILNNKKERILISALGFERLNEIFNKY